MTSLLFLLLAAAVLLVQRPHIAADQAFHQLFDVVITQILGQQGDALLLGLGTQHIAHAQDENNQQH